MPEQGEAQAERETRAPRRGEELDVARLRAYLDAHLSKDVLGDEDAGVGEPPNELIVEQFPGGHSNLTYLVRYRGRELVLRRPPVGSKVATAHDMGREVRVLSGLARVWPKAPRPLVYCEDEAVLGCRFYVMERLRGVIVRGEGGPSGSTLTPEVARRMCEALVDGLVELHAVDYAAAGLGELGRPEGYVERQVRGWSERYQGARTDAIPAIDEVGAWLRGHLPASGAPTLLHNDYKFDNLVFDPPKAQGDLGRIAGVLDWEMATVGDPLMDLGTSLAYWTEAGDPASLRALRFGPTTLPGMMTRAEVAARYAERSGRTVRDVVFYYAFGLFKTAVVGQQIYYRWKQGLTRDPRFGGLIDAVRLLGVQAARAIELGSL